MSCSRVGFRCVSSSACTARCARPPSSTFSQSVARVAQPHVNVRQEKALRARAGLSAPSFSGELRCSLAFSWISISTASASVKRTDFSSGAEITTARRTLSLSRAPPVGRLNRGWQNSVYRIGMLAILMAITIQYEHADLVALVSPERLKATVERLASFHTRNTNSPQLTEAAEWLTAQFRAIPSVEVELMRYTIHQSRRVPETKEVVQVVATLRGESDRVILVGGHLDTLNLQGDPVTARAPGANDDASGVALVLELARVMSRKKWKHTLVFVGFTGEEQGLLGSTALAEKAKQEGWKIDAMLNNDTVGSSSNKNGQFDPTRVRVFSEQSEQHQSRELARFIEWVTREKVPHSGVRLGPMQNREQSDWFGVKLVFRRDRFGRGGDHTPFANGGFPAVRFIEVYEEYTRQHTEEDLPEFMDFEYLANVTRMNLVAMAALANAGPQPRNVRIERCQGQDTRLTWEADAGGNYVVYWRGTTSPVWQGAIPVGPVAEYTVEKVNKDDHEFAVGAVGGLPVPAG
ncbi:MAG: peptidase M28 [Armatimonadota bacterium]